MTTGDEALQGWLDAFAHERGISPDFKAASDHDYDCRCALCLAWWVRMGPDPVTGRHGPFTDEEIMRARRERQ